MWEEVSKGKKLHGEELQSSCIVLDVTRKMNTALFLMQIWVNIVEGELRF